MLNEMESCSENELSEDSPEIVFLSDEENNDEITVISLPRSPKHEEDFFDAESGASNIVSGCRVMVKMDALNKYVLGEIVLIRKNPTRYYVHYTDFNRRRDAWVDEDYLDMSTILFPVTKRQRASRPSKDDRNVPKDVKKEDIEYIPWSEKAAAAINCYKARKDREHKEFNFKGRNIEKILLNGYILIPWYFSPFPYTLSTCQRLDLCSWCLKPFSSFEQSMEHMGFCDLKSPPGKKMYEKANLAFFEIDGVIDDVYCMNLSLLAKLFLDHKTTLYDSSPFWFYVLCECDEMGWYNIVGYFSKEKLSKEGYNLSCILVLPQFQQKGYGQFLIEFSYFLSKQEGKLGSPERPLSDLGFLSYRSYWLFATLDNIISKFLSYDGTFHSLMECFKRDVMFETLEIAKETSINPQDIMTTLKYYGMVSQDNDATAICSVWPSLIDKYLHRKKHGIHFDKKYLLQWKLPEITRTGEHIKTS